MLVTDVVGKTEYGRVYELEIDMEAKLKALEMANIGFACIFKQDFEVRTGFRQNVCLYNPPRSNHIFISDHKGNISFYHL